MKLTTIGSCINRGVVPAIGQDDSLGRERKQRILNICRMPYRIEDDNENGSRHST